MTPPFDEIENMKNELVSGLVKQRRARRRRQATGVVSATIVAAAVLVGVAMPGGGSSGPQPALANVLNRATIAARQDLELAPGQLLYRSSTVYWHRYRDAGYLYDYWGKAGTEYWVAKDGSAQVKIGREQGPSFDASEQARWSADGSPSVLAEDPTKRASLNQARDFDLPKGSLLGFFPTAKLQLGDFAAEQKLVDRVLDAYGLPVERLVALSGNQASFEAAVKTKVRSLIAELRGVDASKVSGAEVERVTGSLVIALFVNWGQGMPAKLRPALLAMLESARGTTLNLNPDFVDEDGKHWIALSAKVGSAPDFQALHNNGDQVLFDPVTFEASGSREYDSQGRIDRTEIVHWGVADQRGVAPASTANEG